MVWENYSVGVYYSILAPDKTEIVSSEQLYPFHDPSSINVAASGSNFLVTFCGHDLYAKRIDSNGIILDDKPIFIAIFSEGL